VLLLGQTYQEKSLIRAVRSLKYARVILHREICANFSVVSLTLASLILLTSGTGSAARAAKPGSGIEHAELVIKNARIYTATPSGWQKAIAIGHGKILFVGDDNAPQIAALSNGQTKIEDGQGRLILPGLHDCHVHLAEGGAELLQCKLNTAKTSTDILALLKKWAAVKKEKWILGAGLPLPAIASTPLDCHILDTVSSTRPLLVYSEDGHSAWLNTRAMKIAKINAASIAPCGGIVELDAKGQPTGCLREGALALVQKVLPVLSLKKRTQALADAIRLANSYGITSAQDAHANQDVLTAYYELARKGKLNLKVVAALHTGVVTSATYQRLEKQAKKYSRQPRLRARCAKIFADGVVESHTAALLAPYEDQPGKSGELNYTGEQMKEMVKELDRRGFQIHIHAIGDRAVKTALDAFSACYDGGQKKDLRHQIAHVQLVAPSDLKRFSELNVTANCQAAWAFQDRYIKDLTAPLLGAERLARVYPFNSLKQAGARLAAGSDWTVSTLNPLDAMQVAVTRESYELATPETLVEGEKKEEPLNISEKLTLDDIVHAYTTGGAYVNHSESDTGSLEAGKSADLVMFDKDIFKLPPGKIASAKVVFTMIDGKIVYCSTITTASGNNASGG